MLTLTLAACMVTASPIVARDVAMPTPEALRTANMVILDSTEDTTTAIALGEFLHADVIAFSQNKAIFLKNTEVAKVYEVDYIRESARVKFSGRWK